MEIPGALENTVGSPCRGALNRRAGKNPRAGGISGIVLIITQPPPQFKGSSSNFAIQAKSHEIRLKRRASCAKMGRILREGGQAADWKESENMREEEKIFAGKLFCPATPELQAIKLRTHNLNVDYNQTYQHETEKRSQILKEMLGQIGEGTFLQGPVYFHYGTHTKIGAHVFINFNFTVQDDAPVEIGDHCDFGPGVTIVTPVHPMRASERLAMLDENGEAKHLCYARPVKIGSNCWFGANVTVCPGVTIGDNCVIGAGSVVTRDIPANHFAAGVPCHPIREITEADSMMHKPDILGGCAVIPEGEAH